VPNAQPVAAEKYEYKLCATRPRCGAWRRTAARDPERLVVGDFNIDLKIATRTTRRNRSARCAFASLRGRRLPGPPVLGSWMCCGYSLAVRSTGSHIDP
jgi:hypothetical protein